MKRINVGIIGLGSVAQVVHLPILSSLADRYKICALCDVSKSLLDLMGARYGVSDLYLDAFELIRQKNLDAVFVLANDEYHSDYTIAALRESRHVFVEKPMCMTLGEADAVIEARDSSGMKLMVGYMRLFAPAFKRAIEAVSEIPNINHVAVRDIIGPNDYFIGQTTDVFRFDDVPRTTQVQREQRLEKLLREALGEVPGDVKSVYRLLCGLSSHDISALRRMVGVPRSVVASAQWKGGLFLTSIFEYPGFYATFETGVDGLGRFDAYIEVSGEQDAVMVRYDTPFLRNLPITVTIKRTEGESHSEQIVRPTYRDPYTIELEHFHEVMAKGIEPEASAEDCVEDLKIFRSIIKSLK